MVDFVLVDIVNPLSLFGVPFSLVDVVNEPAVDVAFWMSNLHSYLGVGLEVFDVDFPVILLDVGR